jgi:hypothetical protein
MSTSETFVAADLTDADLVSRSLAGDREAFGGLVGRYQSLIAQAHMQSSGFFRNAHVLFAAIWPGSSCRCLLWRRLVARRNRRAQRAPWRGRGRTTFRKYLSQIRVERH